MTKVVSTRLSETEHKKFLNECNELACGSSDLLRDIVMDFLNGDNSPSNTKASDPPKATITDITIEKDGKVYDLKGNYLGRADEQKKKVKFMHPTFKFVE